MVEVLLIDACVYLERRRGRRISWTIEKILEKEKSILANWGKRLLII